MKKNILKIFITLVVAVGTTVGVSYVSVQAENPPVTPAPIHTGIGNQEKEGSIWSEKALGAPIGVFKKLMYLPGSNSFIHIGSPSVAPASQSVTSGSPDALAQQINTDIFGNTNQIEPLMIDMVDRNTTLPAATYLLGATQCIPDSSIVWSTNTPGFEFKQGTGKVGISTERAYVIARNIQLNDGSAKKDSMLTSDAKGNARWSKVEVKNGVVVFNNTGNSVVYGGNSCLVPPISGGTPTESFSWMPGTESLCINKKVSIKDVCMGNQGTIITDEATALTKCGGASVPVRDTGETCSGEATGSDIFAYTCSAQATGESVYDDSQSVWRAPGSGSWEKDTSIICTSVMFPKLPKSGQTWFIDGDVVCTKTPPDNTLCRPTGTLNTSKSTCHVGDSQCGS